MPKFNYVAMDSRGKETKGTLNVANQNEAITRLKEMGYFPTKVTEAASAKKKGKKKTKRSAASKKKGKGFQLKLPFGGGVKSKVLTVFTRQLATLVDAGLPLLRGLRVLEKQEKNKRLKFVLGELSASIEGGSTFSEGLAQHPRVFNKLFINMVKAGELGGVLEVVLNRLSEFMEKAQKIKGKVKAAMFYPIAVMVVAVSILTLLMVWVVPKFEEIFQDMLGGEDMPKFTTVVLGISRALVNSFGKVAAGAFAISIVFWLIIKTKYGRITFDWLKLKLPVLGPVVEKVAIARFCRTLGTLVSSGVPILQALTIVRETAGNVIIANAVT